MEFLCSVRVCRALREHYRNDPRHRLILQTHFWDAVRREWVERSKKTQ